MVRTYTLSLPRALVQSLVGELKSHKPQSVAKIKQSVASNVSVTLQDHRSCKSQDLWARLSCVAEDVVREISQVLRITVASQ